MKACVFDIETTALEGVGAGMIICACVRPLSTQRTRDFRLKFREDFNISEDGFLAKEETDLLGELVEELSKYDLLIGHNIVKFDLPYIRSRCYARGVPFDLRPFVYDTMQVWGRVKLRTVMNGYGKPTKSMAMIADFLGLDNGKTQIYPRRHWLTVWGNRKEREEAMQKILDHCQKDVRMNTQIYEIVLPMDDKGSIRRWS